MNLDGTEAEKLAFADALMAADRGHDVYSVISRQDNAVDLYAMYGGFLFLGRLPGRCCSCWPRCSSSTTSRSPRATRTSAALSDHAAGGHEPTGRSAPPSAARCCWCSSCPWSTAGIHMAGGLSHALPSCWQLFSLTRRRPVSPCAPSGPLLVFCAIYALVYGLTTRTYSRIVGGL